MILDTKSLAASTDEQLIELRRMAGQMINDANVRLIAAQKMDARIAEEQFRRRKQAAEV